MLSLHGQDGFPGSQLLSGTSGKSESAGKHQGRAGRSHMDFLGAALPQFLDRKVFQLSSPDNGVLTKDNPVSADHFFNGDEFHRGDEISNLLGRRSIAPPISRSIFYQGPPVGNSGLHRIPDGVPHSGIRDARDEIRLYKIISRKRSPAPLPDQFHTDSFIARGRIAGINPKEGANLIRFLTREFLYQS